MSHAFLFMRPYSIVEDHENTGKNIRPLFENFFERKISRSLTRSHCSAGSKKHCSISSVGVKPFYFWWRVGSFCLIQSPPFPFPTQSTFLKYSTLLDHHVPWNLNYWTLWCTGLKWPNDRWPCGLGHHHYYTYSASLGTCSELRTDWNPQWDQKQVYLTNGTIVKLGKSEADKGQDDSRSIQALGQFSLNIFLVLSLDSSRFHTWISLKFTSLSCALTICANLPCFSQAVLAITISLRR